MLPSKNVPSNPKPSVSIDKTACLYSVCDKISISEEGLHSHSISFQNVPSPTTYIQQCGCVIVWHSHIKSSFFFFQKRKLASREEWTASFTPSFSPVFPPHSHYNRVQIPWPECELIVELPIYYSLRFSSGLRLEQLTAFDGSVVGNFKHHS